MMFMRSNLLIGLWYQGHYKIAKWWNYYRNLFKQTFRRST